MKSTKQTNKFRRVLSGFLAILMVASLFATWPLTATAATAEEHTAANITQISNDYLKVIASNNRHMLWTTGGNPDSTSDNNKKLLYDATSDAIIKIGSSVSAFAPSNSAATPDGKSLYSYSTMSGIKVERFISFSYNTYTSRYDTVEYKYVLTNTSTSSKSAGVRIFFDTMLGSNDSAPFRIAGQSVTTAKTYTGSSIPQTWQVMDSLTSPTVVASGTFYNDISERPDKVQFLSYGYGSDDSVWDCTASGSIGDSAVNVYFNPTTLAPGESRTVKTYYGLSEYQPDLTREMVWGATAPSELLVNGDYTAYLGNPFSFSGWVTNNGGVSLSNVKATISLPTGLSVSDSVVNIGTLGVGSSSSAFWEITAAPTVRDTTYTYSVTITADGVEPIVKEYTIFVPALVHTHSYEEASYTPPSCTESGTTVYRCTLCDEQTRTYHAALGHHYVSAVEVAATCTTAGVIRHTCTRCDDYYLTYVYAEHTYSVSEYVPATCTVNGYYRYDCDNCDDFYLEEIPGSHSYEAVITKVASATENGEITYTCSLCGDSYVEEIPMRPDANILLVQDRLPWTENVNTAILGRLQDNGYITGWDLTTTARFDSVDLSQYSIIFIANDQSTATYNQLAQFNERITQFVTAGGVVVYGACDHGWAGGNISYALPGGVIKGNYYSYRNYITNGTHNIVTGVLTDGKALTNELLYSTYSSHTYFTNLPENAISILEDANGRPTLVEYPLGNGFVIASGLTWEYTYVRDFVRGTSFAKSVYDDVLVHAVMLSDPCEHTYDDGIIVAPTCEEDGYTLHTCATCGLTMKDQFVPALGHTEGEWVIVTEATHTSTGWKQKVCTVCGDVLAGELIPMIDGPAIRVESVDSVILGQQITFRIVVEGCDPVKSVAIVPSFDRDIFTLVEAKWEIEGYVQSIEEGTLRSVAAFRTATDINTTVYTITLLANEYTDATTVDATFLVQDEDGLREIDVIAKTVSVVACPHDTMSYVSVNDAFHAYTCESCGYGELSAHVFDGVCGASCTLCGQTREGDHSFAAEWYTDADSHWKVCERCGTRSELSEHVYDGVCDATCNICAYERMGAEVILSIGEYNGIKSGAISFIYDGEIAEILDAVWLLEGVSMTDFNLADGRGVFAYADGTTVGGNLLKLTIRAKDTAAWRAALATLAAQLQLQYENGEIINVNLTAENVTGVTPLYCHLFTEQNTDARYLVSEASCTSPATYYYSCERCGECATETFTFGDALGHSYDSVCDADCNVCGETREAPHDYAEGWSNDETHHWHVCELCGATADVGEHTYDGDADKICNDCEYARYLLGDVNDDNVVDAQDAVYLLYEVFFGEETYPVSQPLDFDGNGAEDSDDAVYLLFYVLFPDTYPLHRG